MRRLFANVALCLGTLVAIFAIGEVLCRLLCRPPSGTVVDNFRSAPDGNGQSLKAYRMPDNLFQYTTDGGVRLTPNANILVRNHHTSHRDILIRTNELGFRSPAIAPKAGDERRILVLGDSITLADHVAEEETYASRLEHYLRQTDPATRVINAGIGSVDIVQEAKILRESIDTIAPRTIVVGLYLNDGELSANVLVRPLPGILGKSYFLGYFQRKWLIVRYRLMHRDEFEDANQTWLKEFVNGRELQETDFDYLVVKNARDWGAAWNPATWDIIERNLREMREVAAAHGARLAVILFPVRHQVEAASLHDTPQRYFAERMRELQLPHLDLLPLLRTAWRADPGRQLYYDKCHFTAEGYDLVAQWMAPSVERIGQ
ncbi:MAG: hypothetical protein HY543_04135 [Deltaproteobacteria bacterium]|nr:hypothetical protein [Deltaproteobacteria bacterium]